ncbi:hypothetical protein JCM10450v2_001393 [Rhodotorula kratochvilovae]
MLKLTLFALLGASTVLADISRGKDGGLAVTNNKAEHVEVSDLVLKEVCYRNLYADVDDFETKHSVETLVSDASGKQVFLSDGIKRDFEDTEYYFEEWCYKFTKGREHNKDVVASKGILVGRQVDPANAITSSSFSDDVGGFPGSSADDVLGGGEGASTAVLRARQADGGDDDLASGGSSGGGFGAAPGTSLASSSGGGLDDGADLDLGLSKRQLGSSLSPGGFVGLFNNASNALGVDGVLDGGAKPASAHVEDEDLLKQPLRSTKDGQQTKDDGRSGAKPAQAHVAPSGDDSKLSPQQEATKPERIEGKKAEKRAATPAPEAGYIVRVMRWITVTWDGEDEPDCDKGEVLDVGPQDGLVFE